MADSAGSKAALLHRDFTAIDPAEKLFQCDCGKPQCQIAPFRPLREHMAVLVRAIVSCGMEELLPGYSRGDEPWPGVIYALQMAESIEDVFADPSYVDDTQSGFWCSTAWEREEEDRQEASKYVAALTIFNFAWLAYEAAICEVAGTRYERDKIPVRGRKILRDEAHRVDRLPSLPFLFRLARHLCKTPASWLATLMRLVRPLAAEVWPRRSSAGFFETISHMAATRCPSIGNRTFRPSTGSMQSQG